MTDGGRAGRIEVALRVNGKDETVRVAPDATLAEVLREELRLTGTKIGCGRGECGACTVLLDERPVNSCIVFAAQCGGREVMTIEGLSVGGELGRLERALVEVGAVQCGYCTPGVVLSAHALLASNPRPSREEAAEGMSGNLCRCTGYVKIIDAVLKASR